MQTRLAIPPGDPSRFSFSAAHTRCLTRAIQAAARGETLEAAYWRSAANAAEQRAAVEAHPSHQPSLIARLLTHFGLFGRRLGVVA
ncbi:hypothetical protein HMPREF9946_02139 [Acetobacteraceae bacterium AT-5844]|nr:hypothetical protein HMPREF9946_02139 [Acetobacteraceae bacterium AT-5844]